jgi:uncharacterized iron-regulated membrane protein
MWQQWVTAVLGLVVAIVPFLSLSATGLAWTLLIGGIAVAVLSVWTAIKEQSPEYHQESLREIRQG